ncbi:MAG: GTPase, partial [Rhizobium sp.]|nr:GTPase [Rhizobium sp.]
MSMPLAHYLKDFSAPASPPVGAIGGDFPASDDIGFETDFGGFPQAETVDVEAERRAAYAEGHEAASAELSEKHAAELAALKAAHEEAMAALAAQLMGETAKRLAEGLERVTADVATAVSESAAEALAPFLSEEVAAKAVGDLA